MERKNRKFIFLALLLSASAQAETLSFEDCVRITAANNPDLKNAEFALRSYQDTVKADRGAYYPQLTGSLSAERSSTELVGLGTLTGNNYSATLSGTETVFNGLQSQATVDQAKANTRASEANLQIVKATVSYNLKVAYEGLFYAENLIKLTADITKRRQENLRIVELNFDSGNENRGSLLLSQAYLKDAEFNQLQAQDSLEVAQRQLLQVLGEEPDTPITLKDQVPVHDPEKNADIRSLALVTPTHYQVVAQAEAADAGITVAKSAFFPSLTLAGQTGKSGPTFFPNVNAWSVGATLSYSFFTGGKDYYSTKAASDTWEASVATQKSTDEGLYVSLRQARVAFIEAVEQLSVNKIYLDADIVREKIGREKYNNGILSFEEWDTIETDLINRQKNYLQSEQSRVTAEAAWEKSLGKGVIP